MNKDDLLNLVYDSCELLDAENFDAWLNLCAEEFKYQIRTYSDELGKDMVWMNQDKAGMAHIFKNVRNHERYTGRLRRQITMTRIRSADSQSATVSSAVVVYHTEINGVTQLYAIGTYKDQLKQAQGGLQLVGREVVLETRRLAFGSHVPV